MINDTSVTNTSNSKWVEEEEEDNPWAEKPIVGAGIDGHFAAGAGEAYDCYGQNGEYDSEEEDGEVEFHDMQLFFHAIGEPQLIERFLKHRVTLGQLLIFDEQDLINCGVEAVGERKRILSHTAQMHCEKWQPSSLNDMTAKSLLSSPGIYMAINDVNKHIEYIGVTLKYIRLQVLRSPEILELGKDYVGVPKVLSELDDLSKTTNTTLEEILTLRRRINKYANVATMKPANHIDSQYVRRTKIKLALPSILVTTIVICLSFKVAKFFQL